MPTALERLRELRQPATSSVAGSPRPSASDRLKQLRTQPVPRETTPPPEESPLEKPGLLKFGSDFFENTGKLVGGAILKATAIPVAYGKEGKALETSNKNLQAIDEQAIQKARALRDAGQTDKAQRLLKVVQSHGPATTLEDILPASAKETPLQIAGQAAGTALEWSPFAKGLGLSVKATEKATQAIKPAVDAIKRIPAVGRAIPTIESLSKAYPKLSGAVEGGLEGAKYASAFGAAKEIQNPDASLGSVAGAAVKAAPIGFALGAPLGAIGGALGSRELSQQKAVNDLEDKYIELATGTKAGKNRLDKARLKTEWKNKAGTEGIDPARTLAEDGVVPKQSGAKLDTFEQAQNYEQGVEKLYSTNRRALVAVEDATAPKSLTEWENQAVAKARTQQNVDRGVADDLEKEIRSSFDAYRKEYGENIKLTKVDDIKSARWKDTKFDSTKPLKSDVNYIIGKTGQQIVEDTARMAGYEDVAQLNRHIGDRLEAVKFLRSLNGQTVKGGRLGRYTMRIIGSQIGSSPLGKILGAYGGDAIANMLISTSVAGPVKRLILKEIEAKDPVAYQKAITWIEKQGKEYVQRNTGRLSKIPALPPAGPDTPRAPIAPPSRYGGASGFPSGDTSGAISRPPTVLPIEPRPGQKMLPQTGSPSDTVIPLRGATQFDKQVVPKGKIIEGEIVAPKRPPKLPKGKAPQTGAVPESLRPLIQEVKKYKTAEDFVNAQEMLFHGTSKEAAKRIKKFGTFNQDTANGLSDLTGFAFDPSRPVSLTRDLKTAELYVSPRPEGGDGELLSFLSKNLKIATEKDIKKLGLEKLRGSDSEAFIKELKKNGFDAFDKSSPHDEAVETIVFNKEKLKLTSQDELKAFYHRFRDMP